ncbi:MAG: hypothetical protein FJZ49_06230 [Candidatus Verstraetearchaeota archaeon]|nr:hypothetical protein [Candidatus Verstraetearchaeota archaeon]
MDRTEFIDETFDGIFRDAGRVRVDGLSFSGDGGQGVSRAELMRACICGSNSARGRMVMELVLREAEAGERHAILDVRGVYAPLMEYIPSLRVYRVGSLATVNPFKPPSGMEGEEYAKVASAAVQGVYGLSRDERIYLGRALETCYREGTAEPSIDDLMDRLLRIQAEVQPKEGYKVECLRNVLWEMERGAMGRVLREREVKVKTPAVFDLSPLRTFRERALLAACLLVRAGGWAPTCVVVDPAEWVMGHETAYSFNLLRAVEEALEGLERAGVMAHLCGASPSLLPWNMGERVTSCLYCGPLWDRDLYQIERTFALTREEAREVRHLGEEAALLCVSGRDRPVFVSPRLSQFREVSEEEIKEHMRTLGEEPVDLKAKAGAMTTRMLEKIFRDRGALVYAREMLRLVEGGRVPVEAVNEQKNVLLRAVVKGLRRYFLIMEYVDNAGARWYRLTKVGERALAEMDERTGGEMEEKEDGGRAAR